MCQNRCIKKMFSLLKNEVIEILQNKDDVSIQFWLLNRPYIFIENKRYYLVLDSEIVFNSSTKQYEKYQFSSTIYYIIKPPPGTENLFLIYKDYEVLSFPNKNNICIEGKNIKSIFSREHSDELNHHNLENYILEKYYSFSTIIPLIVYKNTVYFLEKLPPYSFFEFLSNHMVSIEKGSVFYRFGEYKDLDRYVPLYLAEDIDTSLIYRRSDARIMVLVVEKDLNKILLLSKDLVKDISEKMSNKNDVFVKHFAEVFNKGLFIDEHDNFVKVGDDIHDRYLFTLFCALKIEGYILSEEEAYIKGYKEVQLTPGYHHNETVLCDSKNIKIRPIKTTSR